MIGTETEKELRYKRNNPPVKLKQFTKQCFDDNRLGLDNPAFEWSQEKPVLGLKTVSCDGRGGEAPVVTSTSRGRWRQILAACGAFMGSMCMGAALAWPATALPDLRRNPQFSDITAAQESWVNSLMTLGAATACPLAGYCIDKFGRRLTMLLNTLPSIVGSLLIIFAPDVSYVCAGRFFTGFCVGVYTISAPVFIGEVAEKHIRGLLSSGFELLLQVGLLYIYVVGTYASMQIQAVALGIIPIACLFLLLLVPESPRYLLMHQKYDKATRSLMWYRGVDSSVNVNDEYEELKVNVEEQISSRVTSAKTLFTKPLLKPVGIAFGLMLFQQMSAIDAVMGYTVDIFHSAEVDFDENWSTNILGAVELTFCLISALIVDKFGRKVLLILSGGIQGVSLIVLAAYFYVKDVSHSGVAPEGMGWIPIAALIVYSAGFSLGFGPVVWIMMGEILPPRIKGLAAGSVVTFRWLLGFLVTKFFKDVLNVLGDHGGYFAFGVICLAGCFYIFFCVPETKGKSLDEIQLFFAQKDQSPSDRNSHMHIIR